MLPQALLTRTQNEPVSLIVGVVSVCLFAPEIGEFADPETPGHFFRCFYPTGTDAGREALERNVAAGENACGMPVRQQGEIVSTGVIG